jgi:drug/metabolite transporter (DMT)-like permease
MPPSRLVSAATAFFVVGCYGSSLLVNGGASAVFHPLERIFVLGAIRGLTLLLIAAALAALPGAPAPALPLTRASLAPVAVVVIMNAGMLPYATLVARGSAVTVLAPMVGCYAVIPAVVGILRGESAGRAKVAGILLALTAVVILATARGGGGGGGGAPDGAAVALFLLTISAWGFGDVGSAYMGRGVPLLHTVLLSAAGQALTAAAAGLAAVLGGAGAGAAARAPPPPGAAAALALANVAGIVGWLAFVLLGARGGEASTFAPLISLYVFVPAFAAAAGGEVITAQVGAGMICAAVAGCLLAATETPPPPPPPPPPLPAGAAAAAAPAGLAAAAVGAGAAAWQETAGAPAGSGAPPAPPAPAPAAADGAIIVGLPPLRAPLRAVNGSSLGPTPRAGTPRAGTPRNA